MFTKQNTSSNAKPKTGKAMPQPTAAEMASRKSNPRASASVPSIMGRELKIKGDIETTGEIQIDGRVDGNVKTSMLIIGEHGSVYGSILADNVIVRGKVEGKINAFSIELATSANVEAELIQDELSIANGAYFDGKCTRKSSTPSKQKPAAAKKAASGLKM